jgi:hypothetical protein
VQNPDDNLKSGRNIHIHYSCSLERSLSFFYRIIVCRHLGCLEPHRLLQLPQAPSNAVKMSPSHISNCLRRTTPSPPSQLHDTLNIEPIITIHRLTTKFFAHSPSHPNPLVKQIGNFTVFDLINMHRKYKHKQPKNIGYNYLTGSRIVFFRIFTALIYTDIYIHLCCHYVNIYSYWLRKQFSSIVK